MYMAYVQYVCLRASTRTKHLTCDSFPPLLVALKATVTTFTWTTKS